ncbi:N-terminal double-transmembrane domain-containing protein [Rubritalea squalenifaciens DSM 18772]|uniref:N-terminal double-transmembrane domain-containing protein n=1 Tax=Rubritalea squalenifaciens DSM 18772 TaxID=1123071 RepID=A0A1M6NE06_9BACT|nr:BatA and WFA domain-containing protein [Rubritalea squalenifaciens]SHJ93951.1 N-terminal double-transmembrane domain-containing protein [Rubritalea squalenifaciens DSM 18772]
MSFPFLTSNAFFFWLLAVAIPVIIHLLNRRRHRTVKWAAMSFLLKATRESRGKKKLKHILILTCRALAIAALVFALARPLVSGLLGWGGGKLDTVILVLDRSASMEQAYDQSGISKRESIIERVQQSMSELGNPKLILIDSASGQPQTIDSPSVLNEISFTKPTDTKADIPALINTALTHILEGKTGRTEIWVASDMQKSNWDTESGSWNSVRTGFDNLPQKSSLRILSLNNEGSSNVAVRIHSARRQDNELVIDFELTRADDNLKTSLPVTFSVNGVQSSETYELSSQSMRAIKRLELGKNAGSGYGFVSIPADENPRDNSAFFAYGESSPTLTAVVADSAEARDYLSIAAAPPGYAKQEVQAFTPRQVADIPWQGVSLLLWQAALPEEDDQKRILDFVDQGGAVVFFPSDAESNNSFLGTQFAELQESPRNQYFIIDFWDQTDGPLRNGLEGTKIPMAKLRAIKRRSITGEATSLANWDDKATFLSRSVHGSGTVIFVSTAPDYSWSNLAEADFILPIVQRSLDKGSDRFDAGYTAEVGSKRSLPQVVGENRSRKDNYSESNSINGSYEAGVWQMGERIIATNRPESEDNWTIATEEDLNSALEDTPYELFEDSGGEDDSFAQEIWRAFLVAMLVFLITEAFLCLNPKRQQPNTKLAQ